SPNPADVGRQPEAKSKWEASDASVVASFTSPPSKVESEPALASEKVSSAVESENIRSEAPAPPTEVVVNQIQLAPAPAQPPAGNLQTPSPPAKKKLFTTTKHDMLAPQRAELKKLAPSSAAPPAPMEEPQIDREADGVIQTGDLPPITVPQATSETQQDTN